MTSLMQLALHVLPLRTVRLAANRLAAKSPIRRLSALSLTLLFLAGGSLSAVAQSKVPAAIASSSGQTSSTQTFGSQTFSSQLNESAQLETDIQQMVAQVIAAETTNWSPAQKTALKEMEAMGLKNEELIAIASLTPSEMSTQLKSNPKLSKLSTISISNEEALKLAPTLLLSRYLFNIGRAALWGSVISAIRSADFDYRAMTSALTSGNTREFMSLLSDGFTTDQSRFTHLVGTAATFACGSATLDVTPGLCSRFASGMQKIFTRVNRSNTRTIRRRALPIAAPSKATAKPQS
ncbi:MAG: hypothetical protein ACFB0D_22270 [Phormidesmis sp.]